MMPAETTPYSFKNAKDCLKFCKDNDVQSVAFQVQDLRGTMHHIDFHISIVDEGFFKNGQMMDGSSINGWETIDNSDLIMMPDLSKCYMDPFTAQPTLKIFCNMMRPESNELYDLDPRNVADRAEKYLASAKIAETAFFGPEPEFFVFEDIQVETQSNAIGYLVDSPELPENSVRDYTGGNMGHRPKSKGGYFPEAPVDSLGDLRGEMLSVLQNMGVAVEKHHHEVAPAQCELGIKYSTLRDCADNVQLYKFAVRNVAAAYGKTATFMPKPLYNDNGSGMHVHQSLAKGGKSLFSGKEYGGLSENALFYIGGLIKHGKALSAFTNPSTNSYKRLVPGYEAPVYLAYSAKNRSAALRIPHSPDVARRVEARFPDPTANPYLAFSAMLMAGLDGIKNKIHPGEASDFDLYEASPETLKDTPRISRNLREALAALRKDHEFLLHGDVFNMRLLKHYIELKMEEIEAIETMPHPAEFQMYYSS